MLMRLFYANARGLRECTESRERSGEDGVDLEQREKTELATRRKVNPLTPSYAHMTSACEWVSETQRSTLRLSPEDRWR